MAGSGNVALSWNPSGSDIVQSTKRDPNTDDSDTLLPQLGNQAQSFVQKT